MLRLHLSSRHLITTGNKATLARTLHKVLHLTVPATTADSTGNVTVPPPTFTSVNSSTPATKTVTPTTNSLRISDLPPALQQQFSSLMQQYINNAALQPNLSLASDCDNSHGPMSTLPQSFNAAALIFTQTSANRTSAANAPLYQVAGQRLASTTYQPPAISTSLTPLQLLNPQHTQPQQLPAASTIQQALLTTTLPPQQLLPAATLLTQQLLPAATLPTQQLLPAATLPTQQLLPAAIPQQPAAATLPPQQLAASILPPQQTLSGSPLLPQQLLAASTLLPVPAQLHQQIV